MAGGVAKNHKQWEKFTDNKWVLDMAKGLPIELSQIPTQLAIPDSAQTEPLRDKALKDQIDLMLQQGIVETTFPSERAYVSHMFLKEKADGSYRPILNLSNLNEYTPYKHFKMDHINVVMDTLPQGSYMASLDISQAYHSISVKERDRDFLQFQFHGQRYRFTCLPNGYSPGPRVFTRIMKTLFTHIRVKHGVNLLFYIDDTIIYGKTEREVQQGVQVTLEILQQAGFTVNTKKSVMNPSTKLEYLGFLIDSVKQTLTIPPKKLDGIQESIKDMLSNSRVPIRKFAGLVGRLAATAPANDKAKVLIKTLQVAMIMALAIHKGCYDKPIYLKPKVKRSLEEWQRTLGTASKVYREILPDLTVYTDASTTGWGCHQWESNLHYGEEWCIDLKRLHINILELEAVLLALKHLKRRVKGKHIHLFIDNTTAISCLKKGGSTASRSCNEVTERLYRWAWAQGTTFQMTYCPTEQNIHADKASRQFATSAEWTLNQATAKALFKKWGKPHIDLFASAHNYQCKHYVSLHADNKAWGTNAFTLNWSNLHVLIFPPFSLIGRVINKVNRDRPVGILIVPDWPSQPWYPSLRNLQGYNTRITIQVDKNTLLWPLQPNRLFPLSGRSRLLCINLLPTCGRH